MHQAPPVAYPLGSAQTLRRWVGAAWALVLVIDVLWLFQAEWQDGKLWLGLGLTTLAGACAYRFRPTRGNGLLQWDGSAWSYRDGECETAGGVTVHLDLQSALLVHWTPGSGSGAWHWLSSAAEPSRWLALRRQELADQATEAFVAVRLERNRPTGEQSPGWIKRKLAVLSRCLDALDEEAFRSDDVPTIGHVAVGVLLGHLDFRRTAEDVDWRSERARLAAWYETFAQRPSMTSTRPHD